MPPSSKDRARIQPTSVGRRQRQKILPFTASWLQQVMFWILFLISGAHGNQQLPASHLSGLHNHLVPEHGFKLAGSTPEPEEASKTAGTEILASMASAAVAAITRPGPGEKGDLTVFSWRFKRRRVGLSRTCLPKWVTRRFKCGYDQNSYESFILCRRFNHVYSSSVHSNLFHMQFCINSKTHVPTQFSFPCTGEQKSETKRGCS